MNYKLLLLFFLFISSIYPQKTFFIKYKDHVSRNILSEKIVTNNIIPEGLNNSLFKLSADYKVEWFARNIAKSIPGLNSILKVTFQNNMDITTVTNLSKYDTDIEYIQEAHVLKTETIPNDSLVNEQWALSKIKAFDSWNISKGIDTVLLAIIDTGIDYLHPDLKNKIFINSAETGLDNLGRDKRNNGIDDDQNGFIDDYQGWDFVDRVGFPYDTTGGDYLSWDNDPMDDHFHGTYVAGIAAAQTNNTIGIAGTAPDIKVLNARTFDPTGNGEEDDAAAAILYAVQMGAKVINMSFGDNSFSMVLRDVIRYAYSRNVVLIASAGNSNSALPHYPSGYSEVISVGNSTPEDYVSSNSNYGSTLDLVAPGTNIVSTTKGGGYLNSGGTSASAPFVSATAALILSLNNFSNEEVKQILKSSCDDILEPGWDLRSGSGRLNINRALSILAPAEIKINYPFEDFTTNKDSLVINISVISPYFLKYDLFLGRGLNPTEWTSLKTDQQNQVVKEDIYRLSLNNLPDSAYTIRLTVTQNNGNTTEERTNFYIIRSTPKVEVVGIGPVYYGNISTIVGELYTSHRCITKLFYKKSNESIYRFISLDGFNTNNQFVKQFHYGIIPKNVVEPNSIYQVYFEAENLAGLKTTVKDTVNNLPVDFIVRTDQTTSAIAYVEMPYKLPKGDIFDRPVNFLSGVKNQIMEQLYYDSQDSYYTLYTLQNDQFVKHAGDSIKNKYPRFVGELNNNNKIDLVSSNSDYIGYLDEQSSSLSFSFNNIKSDSSHKFFPVFVEDIDKDGKYEVISNFQQEKLLAYNVESDLSLTLIDTLENFSYVDPFEDQIGVSPSATFNVISADMDKNGKNELWFVDFDGDLLSYNYQQGNFVKGDSIIDRYSLGGLFSNAISKGDYDGDGADDIAVLFSVNGNIAPLFIVNVYSYKNQKYQLIFQKIFLDQSSEFRGFTFKKEYQTIKLEDIDNDNSSELLINIFPNSYIFKKISTDKLVFFKEGTNENVIFIGDLNQNGTTEVAYQEADGYHFYEFGAPTRALPPSFVKGYSISNNASRLEWKSENFMFYIYRGTTLNELTLIDSVTGRTYYNNLGLSDSTNYYYGIKSVDPSKPEPVSTFSELIKIYVHTPAKLISVNSNSANSVIVNFSDRVNNTIENLQAFELKGIGFPNSISPYSQKSYLLSFKQSIPTGANLLRVSSLSDFYGSPIVNDSIIFDAINVPGEQFFIISSHSIINPFKIKVVFSLPVDQITVTDVRNYKFQPVNQVVSVETNLSEPNAIIINLDRKKPVGSLGLQYRLKIENILSTPETGSIKIASESGSYIILTAFAQDLSDVFVYPNPVHLQSSTSKVTFANLPQRAKISIFTLNGVKINEIEETNGDGGVDFELKNMNNESLSSGIYLYRIIRLDENRNEVEEKIGKFAILR